MALEIATQGGFIFQATTEPRRNQGLTGVFPASGFDYEDFNLASLRAVGKSLEMCP
jgi:predicted cupin superfamily sugar epimerase